MKKNLYISIIVILLIIFGATFYYFGNGVFFKRCPLVKSINCEPLQPDSVYCNYEYVNWLSENCPDVIVGH